MYTVTTLRVTRTNSIIVCFKSTKESVVQQVVMPGRNKRQHLTGFRENGGSSRRVALQRLREVGDDAVTILIEVYDDSNTLLSVIHPQ